MRPNHVKGAAEPTLAAARAHTVARGKGPYICIICCTERVGKADDGGVPVAAVAATLRAAWVAKTSCSASPVMWVATLHKISPASAMDPALPTMWIIEGLLEYLSPSAHPGLFRLASERGGVAGSRLAMQVLEPSWAQRVLQLGAKELPYAELDDSEVTARAVRAAGWGTVRIVRQEGFWTRYGRETHEGFTMVFASDDLRSIYDLT